MKWDLIDADLNIIKVIKKREILTSSRIVIIFW